MATSCHTCKAGRYTDIYTSNLDLATASNVTPVNVVRRVEKATHIEIMEANIDVSGENIVKDGRNAITLTRTTPAYQLGGGRHNVMQTRVKEYGSTVEFSILPGELSNNVPMHIILSVLQSKIDKFTTETLGKIRIVSFLEEVNMIDYAKFEQLAFAHENPYVQFTVCVNHPTQPTLVCHSFKGQTSAIPKNYVVMSTTVGPIVFTISMIHFAMDTEITYPDKPFSSSDLRSPSFRSSFCEMLNNSTREWPFGGKIEWSLQPQEKFEGFRNDEMSVFSVSCKPDETKDGLPIEFVTSSTLLGSRATGYDGIPLPLWRMLTETQYVNPDPSTWPNSKHWIDNNPFEDPLYEVARTFSQESVNREIGRITNYIPDWQNNNELPFVYAEDADWYMQNINYSRTGRLRYIPILTSSRISPFISPVTWDSSGHGTWSTGSDLASLRFPSPANLMPYPPSQPQPDMDAWLTACILTNLKVGTLQDLIPTSLAPRNYTLNSNNHITVRMRGGNPKQTFRLKIDPSLISTPFARIVGCSSWIATPSIKYISFDNTGQIEFPEPFDLEYFKTEYWDKGYNPMMDYPKIEGRLIYEYTETKTLYMQNIGANSVSIQEFVAILDETLKTKFDGSLQVEISVSNNRLKWSTSGKDAYQIRFNETTIPNKLIGLPATNGPSVVEIGKDSPYYSPLMPVMPRFNYVFVKVSPYDPCLVTTQGTSNEDGMTPDFDAHFAIPVGNAANGSSSVALIDASTAVSGRFVVPFGRTCSVNRLQIVLVDRDNNPLHDTKFEMVLRCHQQ